jgi:ABC-2 type transport system ATP-binding protein
VRKMRDSEWMAATSAVGVPSPPAVEIQGVSHHYGTRRALDRVTLEIARGEVFAFLGPNGGGKSTLFRLLSTLVPIQTGSMRVAGYDLSGPLSEVRRSLGVVFQSPSLDRKLTVLENLQHQAALYGLRPATIRDGIDLLLDQLGLSERRHELAETLSGGLRRRVELAKGLIHQPNLLLLDEPTAGLDPGARSDFWQALRQLAATRQMTIVFTTHLLDEAERADRIAILDRGTLVALDTPEALRASVGGDSITLSTDQPDRLAELVRTRFEVTAQVLAGAVRVEQPSGHHWVARLVEAFPDEIHSVTLGKPTLEDVFIARTGHRFWQAEGERETGG